MLREDNSDVCSAFHFISSGYTFDDISFMLRDKRSFNREMRFILTENKSSIVSLFPKDLLKRFYGVFGVKKVKMDRRLYDRILKIKTETVQKRAAAVEAEGFFKLKEEETQGDLLKFLKLSFHDDVVTEITREGGELSIWIEQIFGKVALCFSDILDIWGDFDSIKGLPYLTHELYRKEDFYEYNAVFADRSLRVHFRQFSLRFACRTLLEYAESFAPGDRVEGFELPPLFDPGFLFNGAANFVEAKEAFSVPLTSAENRVSVLSSFLSRFTRGSYDEESGAFRHGGFSELFFGEEKTDFELLKECLSACAGETLYGPFERAYHLYRSEISEEEKRQAIAKIDGEIGEGCLITSDIMAVLKKNAEEQEIARNTPGFDELFQSRELYARLSDYVKKIAGED